MTEDLQQLRADLQKTRENLVQDVQHLRELLLEEVDPERKAQGEELLALVESWLEATDILIGPREEK